VLWYSRNERSFSLLLGLELALSAASGLSIVGVAPVLRKLFKKTTIEDITPEWIESFSVDRYRPMMGLLSDNDLTSSQDSLDLMTASIRNFAESAWIFSTNTSRA
jgi:hypothetical protein